jgi:hypothetical protein
MKNDISRQLRIVCVNPRAVWDPCGLCYVVTLCITNTLLSRKLNI